MSKPWYQSKVVWVNALTVIVACAAFFGVAPDQRLTDEIAGGLIAISPVINLLLRFVTDKPLS